MPAPAPLPRALPTVAGQLDLELIARLTQEFATSFDVAATLAKAVALVTETVEAEGGALFLLEDDGQELVCRACTGPVDLRGLRLRRGEGIVGRAVEENRCQLVRDVSADRGFNAAVDARSGFRTRSILCAPMRVQDEPLGAIELVNKRRGDGLFSDADRHLLQALASSAGLLVLNARLAARVAKQERVRRELELAAELQRSLLPAAPTPRFPVHGINAAAYEVSGDFFDFFTLPDGRIAFDVGDVSGKGMNAALLMAKTSSVYRCLAKSEDGPGRQLALLNDDIHERATRGMFVTMVAGVYEPDSGRVRLANAGHMPCLYRARDGTFRRIAAEAPPLGILRHDPDEALPETELELAGGALYVFTDGVTEGCAEDGRELGIDGFERLVTEHGHLPPAERLETMVGRFRQGTFRDDVTILVVEDGERPVQVGVPESHPGERLLEMRFPAKADWLKLVREAVREATARCGGRGAVEDVVLAVGEACQNIIRHAYAGTPGGEIVLTLRRKGCDLVVLLRDFAAPVDPSTVKPRDLDDVRPGGLGTHFIRQLVDEVELLRPRSGVGNVLRLVKRIA